MPMHLKDKRLAAPLDIVSMLLSLLWAVSLSLHIKFGPALEYSFAATSFVLYGIGYFLGFVQHTKRQKGQLFGVSLILIAGILAAPEAHRLVGNATVYGLVGLVILDVSVVIVIVVLLIAIVHRLSRSSCANS